jgi:hypothetical protein
MQLSTQHSGAGAYNPGDGGGGGDPHETKLTMSGVNKGQARATCGARIHETGAVGVTDPRMMAAQEGQEKRLGEAATKKAEKDAGKAEKLLTLLNELECAADKLRKEAPQPLVGTCKTYLKLRLAVSVIKREMQVEVDCKEALTFRDGLIQVASLRVLKADSTPAALPLTTAPQANLAKRPASPAPTAPDDNGKRPRRRP